MGKQGEEEREQSGGREQRKLWTRALVWFMQEDRSEAGSTGVGLAGQKAAEDRCLALGQEDPGPGGEEPNITMWLGVWLSMGPFAFIKGTPGRRVGHR